ncbi:MAG: hypothetical protein FJ221_16620, partial [Lentisphaerae bacterium]|nr:hypothetical protein [Lentisphaerota bacterium]
MADVAEVEDEGRGAWGEGRGGRDEGRGARGEGRGGRDEGRGARGEGRSGGVRILRPSTLDPRPFPLRHL